MSVLGEIENLEYEIKQQENKLEDLKKRLDKLLMIRPMSDEERQRSTVKKETSMENVCILWRSSLQ
jgi:predicted RNase H-like nuclease (RuvC/YqgF family)